MQTFAQFVLTEAPHNEVKYYKEWGLIHPSGKIISGYDHPTARNHNELRHAIGGKWHGDEHAGYAHVAYPDKPMEDHLFIQNITKKNTPGILKSYNDLPHAHTNWVYGHNWRMKRRDAKESIKTHLW